MDKLNKGTSWITIKGSPGEGKTTVAYMALSELIKSWRDVFQVKSPEEFTEIRLSYPRAVIMLDDIFGDLDFEHEAWQRWKPVIHEVLDIEEHRSHVQGNTALRNNKGAILFVGRDYVIKSAIGHIGKLSEFFVSGLFVVDMSHTVERSTEEKRRIWEAVVGANGIVLEQYRINRIFHLKGNHGFPHVCRLFVLMHKENTNLDVEQFFETPLKFLSNTVKVFLENDSKLALFKEMIKRDGKVSQRELEEIGSRNDVLKTAKDLHGTYLRTEDGYYEFDHPSIYDSVSFNLCYYQPLFIIENCELSFIKQRLRFELLQTENTGHESVSADSETEMVVHISRHEVGDLAKRFAAEILKGNIYSVLSHEACFDETFVWQMMPQIKIPCEELVNMKDKNIGWDFLFLAVIRKSLPLLKYLQKLCQRRK